MPFISIALAALLILMGTYAKHDGLEQITSKQSRASVSGRSMRVVANAAGAFVAEHPAVSGPVSGQDLAPYLPKWFGMQDWIHVHAAASRAFVFMTADVAPSASALFDVQDFPVASVGIARGGKLITPRYPEGIDYPLPAAIPDGALVYVV